MQVQLPKENSLYKNHSNFLDSISNFSGLKQDELLKKKAILNIKSHKLKYLKKYNIQFWKGLV